MSDIVGDEHYMRLAMEEARLAYAGGEIPVGAVLVIGSEILSSAHNGPIALRDPSAHAEMLVMRRAAAKAGNYRLTGTTLYVTLEPCVMCAGAMIHARIRRLVFGAFDTKSGAVRSLYRILDGEQLNHRVEVSGGIMAGECGEIMSRFFREKRITSPPASAA